MNKKIYKFGDSGTNVMLIQAALRSLGYYTGGRDDCCDGQYGSVTERSVKYFQQRVGITSDGVFSKDTYGHLRMMVPLYYALPFDAPMPVTKLLTNTSKKYIEIDNFRDPDVFPALFSELDPIITPIAPNWRSAGCVTPPLQFGDNLWSYQFSVGRTPRRPSRHIFLWESKVEYPKHATTKETKPDQPAAMWTYWYEKKGLEDALHDYYPNASETPEIKAALAKIAQGQQEIDQWMLKQAAQEPELGEESCE